MSDERNLEIARRAGESELAQQEEIRGDERTVLFLPNRGGRGPQALIQAYTSTPSTDGPELARNAASEEDEPELDRAGDDTPNPQDLGSEAILVQYLPTVDIRYSRLQIREVDEESLSDLARSIQERGVIQPILVRPSNLGGYELIAGERRLRASRLAGLTEIPALVTDVSDQDSLELAIIENAQREDLNPIEEAAAYLRLTQEFSLTQSEVSQAVGKSRAAVANSLRLLHLPEEVIGLLKSGELSAGHGKALLAADGGENQIRYARIAVKNALSVRALERLITTVGEESELAEAEPEREALNRASERVASFLQLERVKLRRDTQGRKVMTVTFETEASWKRFLAKIRD